MRCHIADTVSAHRALPFHAVLGARIADTDTYRRRLPQGDRPSNLYRVRLVSDPDLVPDLAPDLGRVRHRPLLFRRPVFRS